MEQDQKKVREIILPAPVKAPEVKPNPKTLPEWLNPNRVPEKVSVRQA